MKAHVVYSRALARLGLLALLSIFVHPPSTSHAQTTAFTYQGRLTVAGVPANGSYDFRTAVVDSDNETALTLAGPKTNSAVLVSNGLFNLTLDFGEAAFSGALVWLEVGVRPSGGGSFNLLLPRQPVTSAPYALRARSFSGLEKLEQLLADKFNGGAQ